jgi:hypothetical protein
MSFKEIVSEGEDVIITQRSRAFGTFPVEAFKVDGRTGSVLVKGATLPYLQLAVTGSNGAGPVVFPGAQVGDFVSSVTNLTAPGNAPGIFETVISVANEIQQTSAVDESAVVFLVLLAHA